MRVASRTAASALAGLALCLAAGAAGAADTAADRTLSQTATGEWVRLSGTVEEINADQFTLNHGSGSVTVELDDIVGFGESLPVPGDKVQVSGRLERMFFEKRSLDARLVYLPKLDETFYSSRAAGSAGDPAGPASGYPWDEVLEDGGISLTGRVEAVHDEMIALDTGFHTVTVDTTRMVDSPVDRKLVETVEVGDRISVTGPVDHAELFDGRKVVATTLYELDDGEG